jgi:hypothetical protein
MGEFQNPEFHDDDPFNEPRSVPPPEWSDGVPLDIGGDSSVPADAAPMPDAPTEDIGIDDLVAQIEGIEVQDEHVPTPQEVVYDQCMEKVTDYVAELRSPDVDSSVGFSPDTGVALHKISVEAAKTDDVASVEANLDALVRVEAVPSSIVDTCCVGIQLGSTKAFDTLRDILGEEKERVQESIAAQRERYPNRLHPYAPSSNLERVVHAYAENNLPPDAWIREYAVDDDHAWSLRTAYHAIGAQTEGLAATEHQAALEDQYRKLGEPEQPRHELILRETETGLKQVQDPELRASMVERFKEAAATVKLTSDTFKLVVRTGTYVAQDPQLTTAENVTHFKDTIERQGERLVAGGMPRVAVEREQLYWKLSYSARLGASPQDMRDQIDLQTSSLLSIASEQAYHPDGHRMRASEPAGILDARTSNLLAFANAYAKRGDFAAARVMLDGFEDSEGQTQAAESVLRYATTPEDVQHVRPDDLALMVNPTLETVYRRAEYRVTGDLDGLHRMAVACAQDTVSETGYVNARIIRENFADVQAQDPAHAADMARDLLGVLRAKGVRYPQTDYLSNALIAAGDPEEPWRAYQAIQSTIQGTGSKLLALWNLAELLREHI